MKKVSFVLYLSFLLAGLLLAYQPVSAVAPYTGINFDIRDSSGGDPWGTASGQKFSVFVQSINLSTGATTTLLNTNVLTSGASGPTLSATCSFGGSCYNGTLGTPGIGDLVLITITMVGTEGDPENINFNFINAGSGQYAAAGVTGTGPTAVTMSSSQAAGQNNLTQTAAALIILLGTGTAVFFRLRGERPLFA